MVIDVVIWQQVVKEKACVKSIEKFQKTVTDLLEDMSIGQSVQLEQQSKVVSENCDVLGCVLRTSTDGNAYLYVTHNVLDSVTRVCVYHMYVCGVFDVLYVCVLCVCVQFIHYLNDVI